MSYQILINGSPLKPSNEDPYVFKSYEDAVNVVCMCYGLEKLNKSVKIIKYENTKTNERANE